MKNYVYIILVTYALWGCTSTGGTIGGLIPAPKLTKGKLEDGLYTAQDGSFTVKTPFNRESYEYTYMEIAERYSELEDNVQFSTSVAPAEVYRVNIFKNVTPEENLRASAFASYRKQFESAYQTSFEDEASEYVSISGDSVVVSTYSQYIPERGSIGAKAQALDVLHSCFYLEKSRNSAFVCANRIAPGTEGSSKESEERVSEFIKSFQLK